VEWENTHTKSQVCVLVSTLQFTDDCVEFSLIDVCSKVGFGAFSEVEETNVERERTHEENSVWTCFHPPVHLRASCIYLLSSLSLKCFNASVCNLI